MDIHKNLRIRPGVTGYCIAQKLKNKTIFNVLFLHYWIHSVFVPIDRDFFFFIFLYQNMIFVKRWAYLVLVPVPSYPSGTIPIDLRSEIHLMLTGLNNL